MKIKKRRHKRILVAMLTFELVLLTGVAAYLYLYFSEHPGKVDSGHIKTTDNGTDFIELSWEPTRNAVSYCVYYKERNESEDSIDFEDGTWDTLISDSTTVTIEGLEKSKTYSVAIRADSPKYKGLTSRPRSFSTQKPQTVIAEDHLIKFTSDEPFDIDARANSKLSFESSDPEVIEIDESSGKAVAKEPGRTKITVKANENLQYTSAEKEIDVMVLDAKPVSISESSVNIIYNLDFDNCSIVTGVSGEGGAVAPQGLAYTGSKYMMTFGTSSASRIVTYDLDGSNKKVKRPTASLGHPNGFTYAAESGLCYCVRGRSNVCVIYDTNRDSFKTINMPVGCSGVGYDPVTKKLCTSARKSLVVYEPDTYEIIKRTGVVPHPGTVYRQDCCAYDGLIICCVSGSNMHGTNYIDIYDMENSNYVGTLLCELSEVESVIVNNEGVLEVLSNGNGDKDYILRTDLNIRALTKELHHDKIGESE